MWPNRVPLSHSLSLSLTITGCLHTAHIWYERAISLAAWFYVMGPLPPVVSCGERTFCFANRDHSHTHFTHMFTHALTHTHTNRLRSAHSHRCRVLHSPACGYVWSAIGGDRAACSFFFVLIGWLPRLLPPLFLHGTVIVLSRLTIFAPNCQSYYWNIPSHLNRVHRDVPPARNTTKVSVHDTSRNLRYRRRARSVNKSLA